MAALILGQTNKMRILNEYNVNISELENSKHFHFTIKKYKNSCIIYNFRNQLKFFC